MDISKTTKQEIAVREAMVQFLLPAADKLKEPCWFTMQGQHEISLRTVTFLSKKNYVATLLTMGLVSVNQNVDVWCPKCDKWNALLDGANIPNYDGVKWSTNSIEVTFTIKDQLLCLATCEHCDTINVGNVVLMHIGNYAIGEKTKASLKQNGGVRPPSRFLLQSARRDLKEALHLHIQEAISNNDKHVKKVIEWADMDLLRARRAHTTGASPIKTTNDIIVASSEISVTHTTGALPDNTTEILLA